MISYVVVVSVWFLLSAVGGISGFFIAQGNQPPVTLGLGVTLPLFLFFMFSKLQKAHFDDLVRKLSPRFLIAAQTWRLLGFLFLIDYARGILPLFFAYPAGLGDFAIGITAPWVALCYGAKAGPRSAFVSWHLFGILDLVSAVTLGILWSKSSFGVLGGGITTVVMTEFPRNMIPTFFVPLLFIFHVISLKKLKHTV
jgi:hypothetical protein